MKIIVLLFFSIAVFSPLCRAEHLCEKYHDITTQWSEVQDIICAHSNNNKEVEATSQLFFRHLQETLSSGKIEEKAMARILEAIKFASIKHQHQTRKNPQSTPYIIHPIGVADHLLIVGQVLDADILIGGLLHDTVEDTNTSFEEIQSCFGSQVEQLVREVTDDKSLPKMERKALQIAHASEKSAGAAQIKLADKFYNLNDLLNNPPLDWEKERIDAYFAWADKVVHALPVVNKALLTAVEKVIDNYSAIKS